jgi:MinD-like ATPase involved in chromosome partitioning or flagellar assembly
MSKIISIHSFRGGTGKSNTTANLACLLAAQGKRVGVVDTDIASPGIHVLFGMEEEDMGHSLNDYLWGKCTIEDTAHDVTNRLGVEVSGKVFLIPSSIKVGEISRILREGYDVGLLNDGFQDLLDDLQLDALFIDTHPGLNEETLLSIAISDILIIILRPDNQDYQGTSVTVDVARKLEVRKMVLLVNKTPEILSPDAVRNQVEETYSTDVAAVIPHSDEFMALASSGIFSLQYPDHKVSGLYKQVLEAVDF